MHLFITKIFNFFIYISLNFLKKTNSFFFNAKWIHLYLKNTYFYSTFLIKKSVTKNKRISWSTKNSKHLTNFSFFSQKSFFNYKNNNFIKLSNTFKNNFLIYFLLNNLKNTLNFFFLSFIKTNFIFKNLNIYFLDIYKRTFGDGFIYIRGLFLIFFIDACVTDDEPLWEPIEWSLVQTWLLFIFIFAWIAENLITSRYGSYTGRDKRVWFAWYKSFWFVELIYVISYGLASLFVIVPFYFELTYSVSFILSWWNWYTRVFFFKFISLFTIIILFANLLQFNIRWLNWKKLFFFVLIINFFIAYLLFTHFIMAFFGYFTDPLWYQKNRTVDYIQLSHEPLKWGWGPAKRDHFTYHKVTTVFWFKNDGQFAGAFLNMHLFLFFSIFFVYLYWVTLLRKIYATKEVTYTFTVFCISSLKQFYYFFFLLYLFIFMSFIVCYWRFPIEFLWMLNSNSWIINFFYIIKDYFFFLLSIFF
jgi:hypothetical protein